MSKDRKITFKHIYLIFVLVLIVLAAAALLYVGSVLSSYEQSRPELAVEQALTDLRKQALNETLWDTYSLEADAAQRAEFCVKLLSDDVSITPKQGQIDETRAAYRISSEKDALFDVTLVMQGEPETKLVVFSVIDWVVESISLAAQPTDYIVEAPSDFTVTVNGEVLSSDSADVLDGVSRYEVKNLIFAPEVAITDASGAVAEYTLTNGVIKPIVFDYTMTLPASLTVTLNGIVHEGTDAQDGLVHHAIRLLEKPELIISDCYGNTVDYTGGGSLPLTFTRLCVPSVYSVSVDGKNVPAECRSAAPYEEYSSFAEFCPDLPLREWMEIAVLRDNADISVKDSAGDSVVIDAMQHENDMSLPAGADSVPADISAEVDVLYLAKQWSLFMTDDLDGDRNGFYTISKHLIEDSYLYDVAYEWATGVDITFTSVHSLQNPPFSNESITNYVRISENCFAVDISLDKHMVLVTGYITDTMNSRFYFVKHDGAWKIAHIKEIL